MSTLCDSKASPPSDSQGIPGSEDTVPQVESAAEPTADIYGSENLPILIQLPDLSALQVQPVDVVVPTEEPAVPAAESHSTRQTPVQEQRERRRRRAQQRAADSHRWIRKFGNLMGAVALASVLFAAFIGLKEWNRKTHDGRHPASAGQAGAPAIDFGTPSVSVPAHLLAGEDTGLSSTDEIGTALDHLDPAALLGLTTDPAETASANDPYSINNNQYVERQGSGVDLPSPASDPVIPATMPPAYPAHESGAGSVPHTATRPAAEGWRQTVPMGGVRQADRSGALYRSPTR